MDPLAKLFGSAARLKLLRLFLFNDDSALSIDDVAYRARVEKEAVRKEIALLVSIGILKKRNGAKAAYQANKQFGYYVPLMTFLRDTTAFADKDLLALFKKAGNLRFVALSGIFTGVIESKADLIIVGDKLEERAIASAVHMIEAEMGRELRYASFTTEDFRYRLGVYDRLIRDVFDYPHRIVLDKIGLK